MHTHSDFDYIPPGHTLYSGYESLKMPGSNPQILLIRGGEGGGQIFLSRNEYLFSGERIFSKYFFPREQIFVGGGGGGGGGLIFFNSGRKKYKV